jgi:hypothetical protein
MEAMELPIYLVAVRDEWLGVDGMPDGAILAFGSIEDAQAFARGCAKQQGKPVSLYRIVEYRFGNSVSEGAESNE